MNEGIFSWSGSGTAAFLLRHRGHGGGGDPPGAFCLGQFSAWQAALAGCLLLLLLGPGNATAQRQRFPGDCDALLQTIRVSDNVRHVAARPDGRVLALDTGGDIQLRDVETGALIRRWSTWSFGLSFLLYSPDGKYLVGGLGDRREVQWWDAITGRPLHRTPNVEDTCYAAAYSPDGKLLATGGDHQVVYLWDAATGKLRGKLQGHAKPIRGLSFGPRGRLLASASEDGTVRIWDVPRRRLHMVLRGHRYPVWHVAFLPDGHRLVASAYSPLPRDKPDDPPTWELVLWDLRLGGMALRREAYAQDMCLAPDGKWLVTRSGLGGTGWLDVWELPQLEYRWTVWSSTHGATGRPGVILPDGKTLVTCLEFQHVIKFWDISRPPNPVVLRAAWGYDWQGRDLWEEGSPWAVQGLVFLSPRELLVSIGGVNRWNYWDGPFSATLFQAPPAPLLERWKLAPDGTSGQKRSIPWSGKKKEEHPTVLASSAAAGLVAVGRADGQVELRSLAKLSLLRTIPAHRPRVPEQVLRKVFLLQPAEQFVVKSLVTGLAFSPDGKRLATAASLFPGWELFSREPRFSELMKHLRKALAVRIWDPRTGRLLDQFLLPGGECNSLAFSPDGKLLAAGGATGTVHLWHLRHRRVIRYLGHPRAKVHALAFSPDGKLLAVAVGGSKQDKSRWRVVVWELATGRRWQFLCPTNAFAIAWRPPQGRQLAFATREALWLWDPRRNQTRRLAVPPLANVNLVTIVSLAFSPDGKLLATGDWGGNVWLWRMDRVR